MIRANLVLLKAFIDLYPMNLISVFVSSGFLRDRLGSYDVAFYLAGIPPIIGGAVLCLIPWVEAKRRRKDEEAADAAEKMLERKIDMQDDAGGREKVDDPESVI